MMDHNRQIALLCRSLKRLNVGRVEFSKLANFEISWRPPADQNDQNLSLSREHVLSALRAHDAKLIDHTENPINNTAENSALNIDPRIICLWHTKFS
jgi:hypothetical protein